MNIKTIASIFVLASASMLAACGGGAPAVETPADDAAAAADDAGDDAAAPGDDAAAMGDDAAAAGDDAAADAPADVPAEGDAPAPEK